MGGPRRAARAGRRREHVCQICRRERIAIKASGFRLAAVSASGGWVECDLPRLRSVLADPVLRTLADRSAHEHSVPRIQAAVVGDATLRPSLEATFHATLDRVVLHTHPVYVNAFACMDAGRDARCGAIREPFVWVGYHAPGFALGRAIDRACVTFRRCHNHPPQAIVLASHGLIASGRTADEVIETTERFVEAGRKEFGPVERAAVEPAAPPPVLVAWAAALRSAIRKPGVLVEPASVGGLIGGTDARVTAAVPDDVVCHLHEVPVVSIDTPPVDWARSTPAVVRRSRGTIRVAGLGYVVVSMGPIAGQNIAENLLANLLVRELVARKGGLTPLPADEIDYLEMMDSERTVRRSPPGPEREYAEPCRSSFPCRAADSGSWTLTIRTLSR